MVQISQSFNQEHLLKDYINIFAYSHKNNQKIAAINLWVNGINILCGATIIKKFDTFKSIQFTETNPPNLEIVFPFINDSLMDATRTITCFENFMKGILILNDYVVHNLSDKNKKLQSAQQKRPIKISEVFTSLSFSNFDKEKPTSWETTFQTLNFSYLLKSSYQEIINLPKDLLLIITKVNEERNKLHFIIRNKFEFGKSTSEKYSKIIEFANGIIKKCILDLDNNMKSMLETIQ